MISKPVPTIKVLRAARKLVANEKTWCRGSYAKTSDGFSVSPDGLGACRWCAQGAVLRAAYRNNLNDTQTDPLISALDRLAAQRSGLGLIQINDHVGRVAALSVIDAAIAELEAK